MQNGPLPANVLHCKSVKIVNAVAQSDMYSTLEAVLNEKEIGILKRGRNANTSKVPKSCTPEQYRKATAIEALFGFLYLEGNIARIQELFELIVK